MTETRIPRRARGPHAALPGQAPKAGSSRDSTARPLGGDEKEEDEAQDLPTAAKLSIRIEQDFFSRALRPMLRVRP